MAKRKLLALVFLVSGFLLMSLAPAFAASPNVVYLPLILNSGAAPAPTPTPTPTEAPANEVTVQDSNTFVPYSGATSLYVVGQLKNNTTGSVRFVKVTAVFRDGSGGEVATKYAYSKIARLTQGMTSPFLIILTNMPAWSTYTLTVEWQASSTGPIGLTILSHTPSWDASNAFHVTGQVQNDTGEERTFVKAFVTLYDAAGKVIGVGDTYVDPHTLAAGATATYDCEVYFWKGKPDTGQASTYLVQVYDD